MAGVTGWQAGTMREKYSNTFFFFLQIACHVVLFEH